MITLTPSPGFPHTRTPLAHLDGPPNDPGTQPTQLKAVGVGYVLRARRQKHTL